MAKKKTENTVAGDVDTGKVHVITADALAGEKKLVDFRLWICGDMPLIVHAWSEKAKRQMLEKQLGRAKVGGREAKNPEEDFRNSLYEMGDGTYGFPAMGIKNCLTSGAHKDKNIPKTAVMAGLWIHGDMTRLRPGLAGAICDMPLLRIYGSKPEMREDMVKIGSGLNKTANLAYRGQFTVWAMELRGRFDAGVLNFGKLALLLNDGGMACGIGEWRNEKKGPFGTFHLASVAESEAWGKFKDGTGPLPVPESHFLQAAE